MIWQELNKETSKQVFDDYLNDEVISCPADYSEMREELLNLFSETMAEIGIGPESIPKKNYSYQVDYLYGIRIYLLLTRKYKMYVREASSAGIWRFISLKVVPDVVMLRYGKEHPDRFWKKDKRLWLRVLWWYAYLSWQGDADSTKNVLKDNSTDEILQLVDRCGRGGYRVDLYRALMLEYSKLDPIERRRKQLFRRMMVLNTARVQVVEPGLVLGGEHRYILDLIEYFNQSESEDKQ